MSNVNSIYESIVNRKLAEFPKYIEAFLSDPVQQAIKSEIVQWSNDPVAKELLKAATENNSELFRLLDSIKELLAELRTLVTAE